MFIVRYGTGVRGDLWCASRDIPASNTRDCAAARQCAHDMKSSVSKVITVILTSRTNYHPVAIPHKYWTSILLELSNYKEYYKISTSFLQLQLFKRISEPIVMQICDFLSKFEVQFVNCTEYTLSLYVPGWRQFKSTYHSFKDIFRFYFFVNWSFRVMRLLYYVCTYAFSNLLW